MDTALTLKRAPVAFTLRPLDKEIGQRAARELHYKPFSAQAQGIDAETSLKKALTALDIEPFDPASVRRYQRAVCRTTWWWVCQLAPLWSGVAFGLLRFVMGPARMDGLIGFALFLSALVGIGVGLVALVNGMTKGGFGNWWPRPLDNTRITVPVFALATALRIRELAPETRFEVEAYNPIWSTIDDPFLVAVAGNYRAYIEVWDEPRFEAERVL